MSDLQVGDSGGDLTVGEAGESNVSFTESIGLTYVDRPDHIYREELPDPFPWRELPVLKQSSENQLRDLAYGAFAGGLLQTFSLNLSSYQEEPSARRRSCVMFHLGGNFPLLTIAPHDRLSSLQDPDQSPFGRKYKVLGPDQEARSLVLDESMRAWLMEANLSFRIEIAGPWLIAHKARVEDDDELAAMVIQAYGFVLRIPGKALARYR